MNTYILKKELDDRITIDQISKTLKDAIIEEDEVTMMAFMEFTVDLYDELFID